MKNDCTYVVPPHADGTCGICKAWKVNAICRNVNSLCALQRICWIRGADGPIQHQNELPGLCSCSAKALGVMPCIYQCLKATVIIFVIDIWQMNWSVSAALFVLQHVVAFSSHEARLGDPFTIQKPWTKKIQQVCRKFSHVLLFLQGLH